MGRGQANSRSRAFVTRIVWRIGFDYQMGDDNIATLEVGRIYVDIIRDQERLSRSDATGVGMRGSRDVGASADPSRGQLAHVN